MAGLLWPPRHWWPEQPQGLLGRRIPPKGLQCQKTCIRKTMHYLLTSQVPHSLCLPRSFLPFHPLNQVRLPSLSRPQLATLGHPGTSISLPLHRWSDSSAHCREGLGIWGQPLPCLSCLVPLTCPTQQAQRANQRLLNLPLFHDCPGSPFTPEQAVPFVTPILSLCTCQSPCLKSPCSRVCVGKSCSAFWGLSCQALPAPHCSQEERLFLLSPLPQHLEHGCGSVNPGSGELLSRSYPP